MKFTPLPVLQTVDVHAKEGKSLTTEGGPENSKNKQETDSKTVEAVEQTQGQIMAVEVAGYNNMPCTTYTQQMLLYNVGLYNAPYTSCPSHHI